MKFFRKAIAFLAVFLMVFGNLTLPALACHFNVLIQKIDDADHPISSDSNIYFTIDYATQFDLAKDITDNTGWTWNTYSNNGSTHLPIGFRARVDTGNTTFIRITEHNGDTNNYTTRSNGDNPNITQYYYIWNGSHDHNGIAAKYNNNNISFLWMDDNLSDNNPMPATFTNYRKPGTLTINKVITGLQSGYVLTDNFTFSLKYNATDANGPFADVAGSTAVLNAANNFAFTYPNNLAWGYYQVVEANASGYDSPIYTVNGNPGNVVTIGRDHRSPSITVTNHAQPGSVTLTKKVDGNAPDTGTVFGFSLYKGATLVGSDTITAGTKDSIAFDKLDWGTYRIVETSASPGYGIDPAYSATNPTNGFVFDVNGTNLNRTFTANNTKDKGSVTLTKKVDGNAPDSGTVFGFSLYKGATLIGSDTITAGTKDSIAFDKLDWGTYRIVETSASPGFGIDPAYSATNPTNGFVFDIGVSSLNRTFTANNTRDKGSVTLTKKVDGSAPDTGTVFEFSLYKGATLIGSDTITAGTKDSIAFDKLDWGTYRIVETSASPGFGIDPAYSATNPTNGFVFDVNGTNLNPTYTANNTKYKGSITVTKSVNGGTPENGTQFEFTLYRVVDGKTTQYKPFLYPNPATVTWGTTANNTVTFPDLPWGTYRVVESFASTGYDLDPAFTDAGYEFTIDGNSLTPSATATNKKLGEITIQKAFPEVSLGNNDDTFTFQVLDKDGVDHWPADKAIMAGDSFTIRNLEWGTYTISENAKPGYKLTGWSGGTLVDGDNINLGVQVDIGALNNVESPVIGYTVTATNDTDNVGRLTISKSVQGSTGDKAEQFRFSVVRDGDSTNHNWADGLTWSNGSLLEITKLPWGTYTITEIPTTGYTLADWTGGTRVSASDVTKGIKVAIGTAGNADLSFSVIATNRKLGSLKLTKKVDGAEAGDTTKFTLTVTGPNSFIQDVELTNGGSYTLTDLAWGTYMITEKTVPAGYRSISGTLSATIGYIGTGEAAVLQLNPEATYENQKLPTIHILKLDSDTRKPVANVTFEIERTDQPGLLAAIFGGKTWTIKTDANGIADLATTELVPGKYLITEIEAPTGYVKAVAQSVTLVAGKTAEVTFYNDPQAFLQLLKTDADTGKALGGAEFKLSRTQDFKEFTTVAVGASGTQVTLVPGTWYVQETKAPTGYDLNTNVFTVTLKLGETTPLSVPDKLIVGALRLIKEDITTKARLTGAMFNIYSDAARTTVAASGLTDATGEINISRLVPGTYWVVEQTAPAGYKLDQTPFSVEIKANEMAIMTLQNTTTDTKDFSDEKAMIRLLKVDGYSQKALEGAKFNLYSDSALKTLVSTGTTDVNGMIEFKDLTPGTYYVVETAAPMGYKLNTTPITLTTEAAKTSTLTISNELDDTKDYQTGSMDYNILIGGGAALLLGGLLVLFTRRRKTTRSPKH